MVCLRKYKSLLWVIYRVKGCGKSEGVIEDEFRVRLWRDLWVMLRYINFKYEGK